MEINPVTMNTAQIMAKLYAKALPGKTLVGFTASSAPEIVVKAPPDWQVEGKGMSVELKEAAKKFMGAKSFKTREALVPVTKTPSLNAAVSNIAFTSAKLAAFQEASGGSVKSINLLTKELYGSTAPEVEKILPSMSESWNVRALVPSSKSHHALFGEEEVARKVNVDSAPLRKEDDDLAVDFGRVLLALKYVGMANGIFHQDLTEFKIYMATPQHIWSYMPKDSFLIPNPKLLHLAPFNKGKILDTTFNQEVWDEHMLKQITDAEKATQESLDIPRDLINIAKENILSRIKGRHVTNYALKDPIESSALLESSNPYDVFKKKHDTFTQDLMTVLGKVISAVAIEAKDGSLFYHLKATQSFMRSSDTDSVTNVIKKVFNITVARKAARYITPHNYQPTLQRILKHWATMVGEPLDVKEKEYFSGFMRLFAYNPGSIYDYFDRCLYAVAKDVFSIKIPAFKSKTIDDWTRYLNSIHDNFNRVKTFWIKRYKGKEQTTEDIKEKVVFQQYYLAFKKIKIDELLTHPLYFELSDHPLIHAASKYVRKRKIKLNIEIKREPLSIEDLGRMLDSMFEKPPDILWEKLAEFMDKKLSQFKRDLLRILDAHGLTLNHEDYAFDEGFYKVEKQVIVPVKPAVKPPSSMKLALMAKLNAIAKGETKRDLDAEMAQCLSEWPTEAFAEYMAKEKGYLTFRDWYFKAPNEKEMFFDPIKFLSAQIRYSQFLKTQNVNGKDEKDPTSDFEEDNEYFEI